MYSPGDQRKPGRGITQPRDRLFNHSCKCAHQTEHAAMFRILNSPVNSVNASRASSKLCARTCARVAYSLNKLLLVFSGHGTRMSTTVKYITHSIEIFFSVSCSTSIIALRYCSEWVRPAARERSARRGRFLAGSPSAGS